MFTVCPLSIYGGRGDCTGEFASYEEAEVWARTNVMSGRFQIKEISPEDIAAGSYRVGNVIYYLKGDTEDESD